MESYFPYLAVLIFFAVLFVISGGTFRAGAAFLRRYLPTLREYSSDETLARALMILFAADMLGAVMTYQTKNEDTASKGYIERGAYGSEDDTAELELALGGELHDVDLTISARKMSAGEIRDALDRAEEVLKSTVTGGMPEDHIDGSLELPQKIADLPVTVSWMSTRPDILDFEGEITENVPPDGTEVTLTAEIACENESREISFHLTVFPELTDEEETFLKEIRKTVASENDETQERVQLPETIDGRTAEWKTRGANTGMLLLLLGFTAAVLFIYSKVRRKQIEEDQRDEQMRLDYPNIVSKLVLLTSAGMSLRKAFARIRDDYQRSRKAGGRKKPGYDEIVRTSYEMEHGVPEVEAYENMGKRVRPREYKTFATLLVQSVTRGGSELNEILKQEAENAVEERKKRARVLGEEAGTKLLFPMVLMLVVVMAILMVPAFFAFM